MAFDYSDYLNEWRVKWLEKRPGNGYIKKYWGEIEREWRNWVNQNQPMIKSRYRQEFSKEERRKHGYAIWAGELRSGGAAEQALDEIFEKYSSMAKLDAAADRKEKGWTGKDFLTAPDGSTTTATGMRYGPYHDGDGYEDRRKWYER